MSRGLVAVVVLGLVVGIAGVVIAEPLAAGGSDPVVISVDMSEASIGELIRGVTTASGANIVMVGDVTGSIALCMP